MRPLPIEISASGLAEQLGLPLHGQDVKLRSVATLEEADPQSLSFLQKGRKAESKAGLLLAAVPVEGFSTLLCPDPLMVLLGLLAGWFPEPKADWRSPAPGVWVATDAVIEEEVQLSPGVVVGPGCLVAAGSTLYPNVVLMHGVRIGRRCRIHAGTVLGADGFRYHPGPTGPIRVPQVGGVSLGEDVEIGANCTIDRGFLGDTSLGRGCKLDDQVHIGHNCQLGNFVLIAAQTGLSGSCRIGDGVWIGGQVGLADRTVIGAGARIGAQSGVHGELPAGETWLGTPARPISVMRRVYASLPELPGLVKKFR